MILRSCAFNWFKKKALKSFKSSYMFKRGGVLSTLGIFKPKKNIKYSRLILMDSNNKDLRENSSQEGSFMWSKPTISRSSNCS